MNEFIKEFGKDNFIVLIAIVGVIFLILIVIVIIEKKNSKKIINQEILNIENKSITELPKEEPKKEVVLPNMIEEEPELLEDSLNDSNSSYQDVYYESNHTTQEEAKEKLEAVTKRLIDEQESDLIEHTHFEEEQEEKSIISYEELLNASHNINQKNDKLLEDEGEAAITIEELYKKHEEEQNKIEEPTNAKVNNPVFENETKKFKNSDVISPVFGVYSDKLKPKTVLKEIDKTIEQKDLEDEIQRTEDFLSELKKLKNKLD